MSARTLVLGLTLVTPLLLSGCFLFAPPAPTGPTPEEIAAQEEAREQQRLQAIEQARTEFLAKVDAAKLAFEAEQTVANLEAYIEVLFSYWRLADETREGMDINAHLEGIMAATTTLLEPRLADWAKKKQRTLALKADLKFLYSYRLSILAARAVQVSEYMVEGPTMLALGALDEDGWEIGERPHPVDVSLIQTIDQLGGRTSVHELCKAALDHAIAEDKRDSSRQHYIMQTCLYRSGSEWEADLLAWASAKQTKAFLEGYRPIRAQEDAEMAQAQAERDAQDAREWEEFDKRQAEVDARIAEAQGGGSSSGGSSSSSSSGSASAGPVSVTVRSSCGSTVKIFFGDDPKFGSGRSSSLSSNSRTNMQMKVGDMIWLTDDQQNGISSFTVSSSTREIEFTCNGISGR